MTQTLLHLAFSASIASHWEGNLQSTNKRRDDLATAHVQTMVARINLASVKSQVRTEGHLK